MTTLPHSPAADRNRQPILTALLGILPPHGTALEIASGTGQHVVAFAAALKGWVWQPTERDAEMLPVIRARVAESGLANVRPPLLLDVAASRWPQQGEPFSQPFFDAIFCANMLHIAPWGACAGLVQGAGRHLAPDGVLITYGPYFEHDVPTAPSNLAFDESLRARNPAWGIRQLEAVAEEARRAGLVLAQRVEMPANNLLLVFRRDR